MYVCSIRLALGSRIKNWMSIKRFSSDQSPHQLFISNLKNTEKEIVDIRFLWSKIYEQCNNYEEHINGGL